MVVLISITFLAFVVTLATVSLWSICHYCIWANQGYKNAMDIVMDLLLLMCTCILTYINYITISWCVLVWQAVI